MRHGRADSWPDLAKFGPTPAEIDSNCNRIPDTSDEFGKNSGQLQPIQAKSVRCRPNQAQILPKLANVGPTRSIPAKVGTQSDRNLSESSECRPDFVSLSSGGFGQVLAVSADFGPSLGKSSRLPDRLLLSASYLRPALIRLPSGLEASTSIKPEQKRIVQKHCTNKYYRTTPWPRHAPHTHTHKPRHANNIRPNPCGCPALRQQRHTKKKPRRPCNKTGARILQTIRGAKSIRCAPRVQQSLQGNRRELSRQVRMFARERETPSELGHLNNSITGQRGPEIALACIASLSLVRRNNTMGFL